MSIISELLSQHVLEAEQAKTLEAEAESSGRRIEELLIEREAADETTVYEAKAKALGRPLRAAAPEDIPPSVLELIGEDAARHYQMVPLEREGTGVTVGMLNPEDLEAQQALKFLGRRDEHAYRTVLIPPSVFREVLEQYRRARREVGKVLQELEEEVAGKKGAVEETRRFVEEAPVTKMVAVILRNAVEGAASDIHVEPEKDRLRVRFRLLGELHPSLYLPSKVHQAIVSRIKILSGMKIDESRVPQDGRFSTTVGDKSVDFRVSTFPTTRGEKVAIRVLDPEAGLKDVEQLGLEGRGLEVVKKAVRLPYGLILATGPTGSGKTTTLYSLLGRMNEEGVNIVSLEDPVEYLIEGVNQSQVRADLGYGFAQGLRQILRQDPDVMMVGEVRDEETATLVTHAALTGHIVLSTLHTNSASGVVSRLLDMGVERYLIPGTLSVAVAQRLVRRLCPDCREKVKADKPTSELVVSALSKAPPDVKKRRDAQLKGEIEVYKAKGCSACGGSGFVGRVGIFEAMEMTDELASIVLGEPTEQAMEREMARQGIPTMAQDGFLKVLDGVTTVEEVLRVTRE